MFTRSKEEVKDQKKEKISEKLKNSLLKTTGTNDNDIWDTRATTLGKESETNVVSDLWVIKDQLDAKERLKGWCISKGNEEYVEGSMVLNNVKKYCTYNIKDKLKNAIDVGSSDGWTNISNSLKNKSLDTDLSDEMKKVKVALNGGQLSGTVANQNALKDWCSKAY